MLEHLPETARGIAVIEVADDGSSVYVLAGASLILSAQSAVIYAQSAGLKNMNIWLFHIGVAVRELTRFCCKI